MTDDTHELQKLLSEQSQRIEALTKENEQLKAEVQEYHNEIVRLREQKKELAEALRGMYHDPRRNYRFDQQEKIEALLKNE